MRFDVLEVSMPHLVIRKVSSLIDIKGVISEAREPFALTLKKDNSERVKRELVLWDDSGPDGSHFVELTIWGQNAHDNFEAGTVFRVAPDSLDEFLSRVF